MPEGHISHRNAGRFRATIVGHTIERAYAPAPRLAHARLERLTGEVITAADAVGKHHLLRFQSGRVLHSHLMMSGVWRLLPASGGEPRAGGLSLALYAGGHIACLYRCPTVRLFEAGEPLPPFLTSTGPDLLDPAIDPAAATAAALGGARADLTVGEALMDQRLVAGIGNVYKSETCFLCGVDPWRPLGQLTAEEAATLGETAARLLADGVRDRGAIRTRRVPGAPPWARGRTWVYRRAGLPCFRCASAIRSRGQGDANRTTYWCPTCQR